jgi:hypothetical protein
MVVNTTGGTGTPLINHTNGAVTYPSTWTGNVVITATNTGTGCALTATHTATSN